MLETLVIVCDWCKGRGVDDNFVLESGWIAERSSLEEGWKLPSFLCNSTAQGIFRRFLANHYAHKDLRVEFRQVYGEHPFQREVKP